MIDDQIHKLHLEVQSIRITQSCLSYAIFAELLAIILILLLK